MTPPAEYPPHRPKRGRDVVASPPPDDPPSLSTLELQLKKIQQEIESRRPVDEDTGVHRINTRMLANQVEAAIAAHHAAESAALRRALGRWAIIIGGVASIIATVAVSVVRAWPTPEATAVQDAVDQQGQRLDEAEQQVQRLDAVERALGGIGEALQDLSRKVDELAAAEQPEAQPEPRRRRGRPTPPSSPPRGD